MYKLPKEYLSLVYLRLGCSLSVEYACRIWNSFHPKDTLRVKEIIETSSEIVLTGTCSDVEESLNICKHLTAIGVRVRYERLSLPLRFNL